MLVIDQDKNLDLAQEKQFVVGSHPSEGCYFPNDLMYYVLKHYEGGRRGDVLRSVVTAEIKRVEEITGRSLRRPLLDLTYYDLEGLKKREIKKLHWREYEKLASRGGSCIDPVRPAHLRDPFKVQVSQSK